ncbi:MAG: hypothetical protein ACREO7_10180 [Pseudoxanthomonas sp.]
MIVIILRFQKRKKALRAFGTPTEEAAGKSAGEVGSAHVARWTVVAVTSGLSLLPEPRLQAWWAVQGSNL